MDEYKDRLLTLATMMASAICVNAGRNGHDFSDPEKIVKTSIGIAKEILLQVQLTQSAESKEAHE